MSTLSEIVLYSSLMFLGLSGLAVIFLFTANAFIEETDELEQAH